MYKKEIDEIYELCKRVANEVPTANASFNYSIYGMSVCALKRKEDVNLPEDKFKWDLYQSVSFNPFYEKESRESLKIIKTFLLELLIDVESDRVEAPADNGTDNDSERASGGAEQAESVHS